ncbi:hypothetical protein CBS101457_000164 [Exobasidium rhododendri]|nr:hypothetical protein CBS101457_000164 [Exobasidium rhododendri]
MRGAQTSRLPTRSGRGRSQRFAVIPDGSPAQHHQDLRGITTSEANNFYYGEMYREDARYYPAPWNSPIDGQLYNSGESQLDAFAPDDHGVSDVVAGYHAAQSSSTAEAHGDEQTEPRVRLPRLTDEERRLRSAKRFVRLCNKQGTITARSQIKYQQAWDLINRSQNPAEEPSDGDYD